MELLKKYYDLIALPGINIGFVAWVQNSDLRVVVNALLTDLVLVATLIFTIVRIYYLLKNKGKKDRS
jgi:hypothetical protein